MQPRIRVLLSSELKIAVGYLLTSPLSIITQNLKRWNRQEAEQDPSPAHEVKPWKVSQADGTGAVLPFRAFPGALLNFGCPGP